MAMIEKKVSYTAHNTYSILNEISPATQKVWIACHGIGYLSKYFIRYFKNFDQDTCVIAPQAPSKYYQNNQFKYVGASWLTRENTALDLENVLNYLDEIYRTESLKHLPLYLMGYSQGVSIITRWLAKRKISCEGLVLHSGSIPQEFTAEDFTSKIKTQVHLIYGTKDEYIHSEHLEGQLKYAQSLFGNQLKLHPFEGKHVVNTEILETINNS